jgi:hypothetical protein
MVHLDNHYQRHYHLFGFKNFAFMSETQKAGQPTLPKKEKKP